MDYIKAKKCRQNEQNQRKWKLAIGTPEPLDSAFSLYKGILNTIHTHCRFIFNRLA